MQQVPDESLTFRFHFVQYASRRAADWAARGFKETLVDFPALNARSKFWGDDQRAAFKNWEEVENIRRPLGERAGHRRAAPAARAAAPGRDEGDAGEPPGRRRPPAHAAAARPDRPGQSAGTCAATSAARSRMGPYAGLTEVLIPAGLRADGLRPDLRAQPRQKALRRHEQQHADDAARSRSAVLARLPRGTGRGESDSQSGVRVRGGVEAARAAARISGIKKSELS